MILFVRPSSYDAENAAAWRWLSPLKEFAVRVVSTADLAEVALRSGEVAVVWCHALSAWPENDAGLLCRWLPGFVENGGRLLLSLYPCTMLGRLGIEDAPPAVLASGEWSGNSGEKVFFGLMSYRGHPIFDEFFGGVYLWQPQPGEPFCEIAYGPASSPARGKVVAVRRVHIGVEPEWKMGIEYDYGRGRLLAIGAYLFFASPQRRFHAHVERFARSCLRYLALAPSTAGRRSHWLPKRIGVRASPESNLSVAVLRPALPPPFGSGMELIALPEKNAPFDLAGRRLLLLGSERGAVREIWAHPFRIWQNVDFSIAEADGPAADWQAPAIAEVRLRPEAILRRGTAGGVRFRQVMTVSPNQPLAAIWIVADRRARLRVAAESDFRLMWPYDAGRLGPLLYLFPENMNGVLVHDREREHVVFLGASSAPLSSEVEDVSGAEASRLRYTAVFEIQAEKPLLLLLGGTNQGLRTAVDAWNEAAADAAVVLRNAVSEVQAVRQRCVRFDCSDRLLSEAAAWALVEASAFFAETPDLGSGWMAGYHTTRPGWHSGRPGYAWYFGRDAVWTSLAMLPAGDFERVRSALQLLGDYQEFTGKIFHELTTSGVVHYDAADSTPLYLILMARYLEWSGDADFVRCQWPRIRKAVEFCFSTDRDGDGLIENSGVGHGWIEGGRLSGADMTLELAGMWAASLEACATLADVAGEGEMAARLRSAARRARAAIDRVFWNEPARFYFYARMADRRFHPACTILATVPILLDTVAPEKADRVLRELAQRGYGADWGARMISDEHPDYDPRGYHQGSVWPLFTGWLSLAEYRRNRATQAFAHLYGSAWQFLDGARGCIEEVLDGDVYQPAGVCPHQAWSETMLLQPLLEGMVGLRPDAVNGRLRLAPQWPPHWTWAALENLRLGDRQVSIRFERRGSEWLYRFENSAAPLEVELRLPLPAAAVLEQAEVNGRTRHLDGEATVRFELEQSAVVRLRVPRYLGIVPPSFRPQSGQPSRGFCVVDETFDGRRFEILCQGEPGALASLGLVLWGYEIADCHGAQICGKGERRRLQFRFPHQGRHANQRIALELKRV